MVIIRREIPEDISGIVSINNEAFGQDNEGRLVNLLRETSSILSLVAVDDNGKLLGHILFSRIQIVSPDGSEFPAVALAPMAVAKKYQNKGIGSRLIREGMKTLQKMEEMIVVVLGHPWYYPKFGFEPAKQYGITPPFKVRDQNAWMVYFLEPDLKGQVEGMVHYPEAFNQV